ncbi:phytoene desaturase [Verrucomicrobiaceae bacterium N1E253]|uniref:Phytoene desaturase n=1 Tax=Oceaniferula marina TaxID=2748318 RepID=A0A851GK69_9BACT|nr:phytoene desaturase family protein [Oceaniferula marina]NWK57549.1 phytoene desaturase [Oceaniferula marina]
MKKKILIIGAGPGGLSSGMLLAHRGYDVTILEKSHVVGGRNAPIQAGNYTFDTGPTFLHQKFTLDEIFAETGRKPEDYMDFVKLDPMTTLSWGDTSMETSFDQDTMTRNIERAFPGESANYRRFMDDHADKLRAIFPCLLSPYHKLSSFFRPHLLKALPYVATTKSVMDVLSEYFTDERLKLAFTFQAKYLGMSPWNCPALFSILSYIEYAHGIYHVQGGLSNISMGMAKAFEEEGGTLRLNCEVKEIHYTGKQASSVSLTNGETLACDKLIVNADYAHARNTIFGKHNESKESLLKKKYSCSTYMLYLGLDTIYRDEPHHHVLFADDYHQNLRDIQNEKVVSDDMSVYIRNSSVTDPTVAPDGHSQLYILVPTINTRNGYPWEENQQAYRDKVLDRIIARTGMKDLRKHIVEERCITPRGWQEADIFIGATFNLAHTMDQMLYLRPQNQLKGFENIYLVGGGTHPGSGLPTIYESARISANLICDSYGKQRRRIDFASDILNKAAL